MLNTPRAIACTIAVHQLSKGWQELVLSVLGPQLAKIQARSVFCRAVRKMERLGLAWAVEPDERTCWRCHVVDALSETLEKLWTPVFFRQDPQNKRHHLDEWLCG